MAAHWLISRDCLLKVGGFSPIFPHYGEDNNYAERTIFHGFKIGIVPGAIAIHDREYREISAEKRMYMSYVGGLILLSGVSQKYSNLRVRLFWQMLRTMLINSSFTPLKNFFQTMKAYSKIRKSVKTSRGVCAFLKQNA